MSSSTNNDDTTYPLSPLLAVDMNNPLPTSTVSTALSSPPFIPLPGALNLRDLGLLPDSPIKPGLLYRSGAVHSIPPSALSSLGVTMILDLRSAKEVERNPDQEVEGVVVNVCVGRETGEVGMVDMNDFIEDGGVKGYKAHYLSIATTHAPFFRNALEWIRDQRGPVLFHCTAGKDRTGILAALVLSLVGAPASLIAYDYALTRIGIEPHREHLLQMLQRWNAAWTLETPGMREFAGCRGEFILGFLEALEERYGGVEGYVKRELGFGEEDVERLRGVLMGKGGEGSLEGFQ